MIDKTIKRYGRKIIDKEQCRLECEKTTVDAVRSFNQDQETTAFTTYLFCCVRNRVVKFAMKEAETLDPLVSMDHVILFDEMGDDPFLHHQTMTKHYTDEKAHILQISIREFQEWMVKRYGKDHITIDLIEALMKGESISNFARTHDTTDYKVRQIIKNQIAPDLKRFLGENYDT